MSQAINPVILELRKLLLFVLNPVDKHRQRFETLLGLSVGYIPRYISAF